MQRTIYHGSSKIVRTPAFGAGTATNDYGLGFYCSEDPSLAGEWAAGRTSDGFVNRYLIETGGLRIINLNSPEYCILHWLAVLLNFREFDAGSQDVYRAIDYVRSGFTVDYQSCDCLVGFRADNCNFNFAQNFLEGRMSYRQFNDAVRLSDTGRQFVLKSNRAFDRLIFDGYSIARSSEVYPAARRRDIEAMRKYAINVTQSESQQAGRQVHHRLNQAIAAPDNRIINTVSELSASDVGMPAYRRSKSVTGNVNRGTTELYIVQIVSEAIRADDPRLL